MGPLHPPPEPAKKAAFWYEGWDPKQLYDGPDRCPGGMSIQVCGRRSTSLELEDIVMQRGGGHSLACDDHVTVGNRNHVNIAVLYSPRSSMCMAATYKPCPVKEVFFASRPRL